MLTAGLGMLPLAGAPGSPRFAAAATASTVRTTSTGDRWIWPGPSDALTGAPSFFDVRRQTLDFLESDQGPVLWTLSPDTPRTWSVIPVANGGPWIDNRWTYDPTGDRVFIPNLAFGYSPGCLGGCGFLAMAELRLGGAPALVYVPVRDSVPGGRDGSICVYDSRRQRVLVIGGKPVNGPDTLSTRVDVLDVVGDTASWSGFDVTAPALPVDEAPAVYDSVSDRVIVVGGVGADGTARQGIYSLDLGSPTGWQAWALSDSLNTWGAQYAGGRLVLDPIRRRLLFTRAPDVILIDGVRKPTAPESGGVSVAAEDSTIVWQLSLDVPTGWEPIPYTGPSHGHNLDQVAYDPSRDRITAYGDFGVNDLKEVVLDGTSPWMRTRYSERVPSQGDERAFMDANHKGVVVEESSDAEIWRVQRGAVDSWRHLDAVGRDGVRGRVQSAIVYDSTTARGFLFGGLNDQTELGDLWQFTIGAGDTVTWQRLSPDGDSPPARWGATAVLDPVRRRMILFGGYATRPLGDTWELTLDPPQRWRRLPDLGAPPSPRFLASAVYDSRRDAMLLYGGNLGSQLNRQLDDDTWSLSFSDGDVWVPIVAAGRPPTPRFGHEAVYDPLRDRMIVMWGFAYSQGRTDCGELDLAGVATWRTFEASGATNLGRAEFGLTYDADHDQALCMGGKRTFVNDASFPSNLYADFSANPVRTPPPLAGPPLAVLGLAPNPTRDVEIVAFDVPVDAMVGARIYDVRGRLVRDLGPKHYVAGRHVLLWDGRNRLGEIPPSGVYFARLSVLGKDFAGKFVLLH